MLRSARLIARLWYLPLLLAVVPVVMAWRFTCPVPHADHWGMFGDPYFSWLDGKPFWEAVHEQCNDSRYDSAKLVSFFLIRFANWNLRMESLICVLIPTGTVTMLLWLLRRTRPGGVLKAWGLAWLSAALLFTPHQWMNWTFGVQTCYAFVVFGTFGVLAAFQTELKLWLRALLAACFAFLACHSFLNGWLAWELGLLYLAWEGWRRGWGNARWLTAATVFLGAMLITALVFFKGFGSAHGTAAEAPLLERLMQNPKDFIGFFINLVGAPFSEGWATWNRETRFALNNAVAPVLGALTLLLLTAVAVGGLRQWRGRGTVVVPFMLMIVWGLDNAIAITIGRTGLAISSAFQSRYPAYTMWLHIGLLGLLFTLDGRFWKWTRRGWLVVILYGYSISFVQGWRDAKRDFLRNQIMSAAVSFRHVAPEPVYLEAVYPGAGAGVLSRMDRLEKMGCLNVGTIRSELTSEAPRAANDFTGEMHKSGYENGHLTLRAWAVNRRHGSPVDAVIFSSQVEGEPEKWFTVAPDRLKEPKVCAKLRIAPFEDRVGWGYPSREADRHAAQHLIKARQTPTGRITFRAYVYDVTIGTVTPLKGEFTATIPAS